MKIIMKVEEIVAAFNGSSKVAEAVLSYYGVHSGDIDSVEVMGEEEPKEDGFCGSDPDGSEFLSRLTQECVRLMANTPTSQRYMVACVKAIREATGLSLTESKSRFDTWRNGGFIGNV